MTNLNLCCETGTDRNGLYPALTYAAFDDKTCAVTGLADRNASPISVTVPAYASDGLRVVAVADKAFSGCQSMRFVSLPETVESVGRRAFAFCTSLSDLRLGRNSRLSCIGDRAFIGCERLTVLRLGHLAGLRMVGNCAFAYCTRLHSVVLPDSLSAIPDGMFEGCRQLLHVRLPGRLIRIGAAAFSACVSLETVRMPDSLRIIEDAAFAWCASLRTLHLPTSPCMVAGSAFRECPALPDLPELLGVS